MRPDASPLPRPRQPAPARAPWLLFVAVALKLIGLAWIAAAGFPREWGDMVMFKQPAYMFLHTGDFTVPTATALLPYADLTYAAYPPFYTYVNLLAFKLFGFSLYTSLGLDMTIHVILCGLITGVLYRQTRNQYIAAFFWLIATHLFYPEGRPEELGTLLIVLALIVIWRTPRRWLLAAGLLGLSVATQPIQAVVGIILAVVLLYVARRPRSQQYVPGTPPSGREVPGTLRAISTDGRGFFSLLSAFIRVHPRLVFRADAQAARAAALVILPILVALLVWLPILARHPREAVTQFLAHSSGRWTPGLLSIIERQWLWAIFFLSLLAMMIGCVALLLTANRRAGWCDAATMRLIVALALASLPGLGLLIALASPFYGYRLLAYLYLAVILYLVARWWQPAARLRLKALAAGLVCWLALVMLPGNLIFARYLVVPFTWTTESVPYPEATAQVARLVAPGATVGGDAILWWTVSDGRPYLALTWTRMEQWPEFILSSTFWGGEGGTTIIRNKTWEARLATEYDELTAPFVPGPVCALRIGGRAYPLSRTGSSCDWRVRVWQRKIAVLR